MRKFLLAIPIFIILWLGVFSTSPNGILNFSILTSTAQSTGENSYVKKEYTTDLIKPGGSPISYGVDGSQYIKQTLQNMHFLGVLLNSHCNYATEDWHFALLPYKSSSRSYTVFRTTPVPWSFTTGSSSSVANVHITLEWQE